MTVAEPNIARRRLKAPREDGEVLLEPSGNELAALIDANIQIFQDVDYDVQGRPFTTLRQQARAEVVAAASEYSSSYLDPSRGTDYPRLLVAGHQPGLFHPGVWLKNAALDGLSRQHGAVGVNLQIDNDTLKSPSIRVPGGSIEAPTAHQVAFDGPLTEIPFEERQIVDRACFEQFDSEVATQIAPFISNPFVKQFWPRVVDRSRHTNLLGASISQARHRLESDWGLSNLELPQSSVCRLESFHWFLAHLLAQMPRFHGVHNVALAEYRRLHHLRSANHPVPELITDGDWLESPFWIWTKSSPGRRRLFVRRKSGQLQLTDRGQLELTLPLEANSSAEDAVKTLARWEQEGIKIRTRALTTTLFARLMVADAFIHGIGGAKYDELTDMLIRRFFGIPVPGIIVVSATLLLPIRREGATPEGARRIDREMRDLTYHPEQFLSGVQGIDAETAQFIAAKRQWIATAKTKENAAERHRAIVRSNEALQPAVASMREALQRKRGEVGQRLRAEDILASREFAFCLYPEKMLQDFLLEFHSDPL